MPVSWRVSSTILYTEEGVSHSSHGRLFATPWTVAHQAFRQLKIHPSHHHIRKEEKRQNIIKASWRCQLSQGWKRESICSQAYSRQLRKHSLAIGLWGALLDGSSSQQQGDGGGSARCTARDEDEWLCLERARCGKDQRCISWQSACQASQMPSAASLGDISQPSVVRRSRKNNFWVTCSQENFALFLGWVDNYSLPQTALF